MKTQHTLFTLILFFILPFGYPSIGTAAEEALESSGAAVQQDSPPPSPAKTKSFDSVEERRIDAVLQNERDNLADDKKVLAIKEKELKTLQEEVDKKLEQIDMKIAELKKLQAQIDQSLKKKAAEEVKKTKELSLIYAKMAPEKAAMAMGTLSNQLASDLLANMKVKAAAKILDQMDKAKAAQLSITFSTIQTE